MAPDSSELRNFKVATGKAAKSELVSRDVVTYGTQFMVVTHTVSCFQNTVYAA